jgi:hypothetical protein
MPSAVLAITPAAPGQGPAHAGQAGDPRHGRDHSERPDPFTYLAPPPAERQPEVDGAGLSTYG